MYRIITCTATNYFLQHYIKLKKKIEKHKTHKIHIKKKKLAIPFRRMIINLHHKTLEMSTYLKKTSTEKQIAYGWLSLQTKIISFIIISYIALVIAYFFYPLYRGDQFPVAGVIPKFFQQLPW